MNNIHLKLNFAMLISGIFFLVSCNKQAPPQSASGPVPVKALPVQKMDGNYFDLYPGTVIALNEVELRAEVSGFITGIFFKEGQTIKKGQKLYEIDRSKYLATYEQASAAVKIAEANLDKVQKDADRYIELSKQDAIPKQRLDYALTDLQNARLQVVSAKADLQKANTDLRFSLITAPFDGTIGISQVKIGTLISQGQTLLNTISSEDPMAVDFVIDEKEISRFLTLEQKTKSKSDSLFTILLPDKALYPFPGKLALIDRAVDPQTGTIRARLYFPNPKKSLKSGMSATVRVLNQIAEKQILIPSKAITEQMGEYFVFVVGDSNKVVQRKIELGTRIRDRYLIKNGLEEGEKIVVDGIQKLRDGVKVNTDSIPSQAPANQAVK